MCNDTVINFEKALLKRLYTEMHTEFSDEYILACYGEINKERRYLAISEAKKHKDNSVFELPSEKQIQYALKLKIVDPEKYDKKTLSKLIDEAK